MTWRGRLKFSLGLILVLVIVAAGTLVFSQRQNTARSTSATIMAESYPIGTDFGGIVVKQYVQEGDSVRAGEKLFQVRSLDLQRNLDAGWTGSDTQQIVSADGTTTVVASVNGRVSAVVVPQGGYAQAGGILARIDKTGTLFVEARMTLTPRDYGRLATGARAEILLPNQTSLTGTVSDIAVATVAGDAASTVTIAVPALKSGATGGLRQPGTPVVATVDLHDDGPLAGVNDQIRDLLRKMGL